LQSFKIAIADQLKSTVNCKEKVADTKLNKKKTEKEDSFCYTSGKSPKLRSDQGA
jgi:hypothetical protein